MLIRIKNLNKSYISETKTITRALEDINLDFKDTGLNFIVGQSGSGKSTLLNIIGGIDDFDSGSVVVANHKISEMSCSQLDNYRNSMVGFIFQELNLLDDMTVRENIKIALDINKTTNEEKIDEVIEKLDIKEIEHNNVKDISSGQKQRVAIARTLVKGASIILADEPTGALDSKNSKEVMNILKKISKEKLVIVITHDIKNAKAYGDRIIELKDGKIVKNIEKGSNKNKNIKVLSKNLIQALNINDSVVKKVNEIKDEYNRKVYISADNNRRKTSVLFKDATFDDLEEEKGFKVVDDSNEKMKDISINKGKLSFKRLFDFAKKNIIRKKNILILTIILMMFSLLLYGVSEGLTNYNKIDSYIETLEKEEIKGINFIESSSSDKFQKISNITINKLKDEYPKIKIAKEYSLPMKIYLNKTYNGSKKYTLTGVSEVNNVTSYGYKLLKGKAELSDYNEIIISEYFAQILIDGEYFVDTSMIDQLIDKEIKLNNNNYKIVGIIKSEYLDKSISKEEILKNYLDIRDNLIFVKEGFVNNYFNNTSYIEYTLDIHLDDNSHLYNPDKLNMANVIFDDYSSNSSLSYTFFNENKTSLLENEILISKSYIENNDLCENECNEHSFDNSELILTYNSNIIFAYKDYKVVGIYDNVNYTSDIDSNLYQNSIIVSSSLKEKINENIYYNYQILVGLSSNNKVNEKFIKDCYSNGLKINKNFTSTYDKYSEIVNEFSDVLNVLNLALLTISIVLLYSFIQNSIMISKRNIGILKSLGINDYNIFSIFLVETLLVAIFTIVGSSGLLLLVSPIINLIVRESYGFYFSALNIDIIIFVKIALTTLTVSIIALVVPFIKFRKMSTTKLIGSR